jgi:hypothetical protein
VLGDRQLRLIVLGATALLVLVGSALLALL